MRKITIIELRHEMFAFSTLHYTFLKFEIVNFKIVIFEIVNFTSMDVKILKKRFVWEIRRPFGEKGQRDLVAEISFWSYD